jgi:hypothetical protein
MDLSGRNDSETAPLLEDQQGISSRQLSPEPKATSETASELLWNLGGLGLAIGSVAMLRCKHPTDGWSSAIIDQADSALENSSYTKICKMFPSRAGPRL